MALGLGLGGAALYRFRRAWLARALRLPPARYHVAEELDLPVPMADGVQLLADHYYPSEGGDFPTILVRTPYGRASELGALGLSQRLIARLFAERGYHVLVQGVRGRFHSKGEFYPFTHEAEDGRATLEWIGQQPWFNGSLGTWGASYLGLTQWAIAAAAPPFLKAMMPITTSSRFSRLFYINGAFSLDGSLRWAYLVNTMIERNGWIDLGVLQKTAAAYRPAAFTNAFQHLPLADADTLSLGKPVPFLRDWLEHPDTDDSYWQAVDHPTAPAKVQAQVHMVAGWYDIFLNDQLTDYARMLAAGRTPYLTIGPQHHLDTTLISDGVREGLAWFDVYLKGQQERLRQRPVRVYLMGADEWHEMDFWPPLATLTRFFLHGDQLLSTVESAEHSPPDHYRYHPAHPTPMIGGSLLNLGAGRHDQRMLEARSDVLTFTTAALEQDVDVIGPVRLELYVRSSLAHTDFVGRLCDVYPDGRSFNVCDGLFRVEPGRGERQPDGSLRLEIDMWATAQRFKAGHRIRVQVCSGGHPRWARNLGTGENQASSTRMRPADQTIYHDANRPSALVLPILPQRAQRTQRAEQEAAHSV
jgi:hypothetical protein